MNNSVPHPSRSLECFYVLGEYLHYESDIILEYHDNLLLQLSSGGNETFCIQNTFLLQWMRDPLGFLSDSAIPRNVSASWT